MRICIRRFQYGKKNVYIESATHIATLEKNKMMILVFYFREGKNKYFF